MVTGEWRKYIMRSLMISTPHPILFGRSNGKNWMGGACNTYGGEEMGVKGFGEET